MVVGGWAADKHVWVPLLMLMRVYGSKEHPSLNPVKPDIVDALRRDRFLAPRWLLALLGGGEAILSDLTGVITQPAAGEITTNSVNRGTVLQPPVCKHEKESVQGGLQKQ